MGSLVIPKPSFAICLIAAVLVHAAALALLVAGRSTSGSDEIISTFRFRMSAIPESAQPLFMVSAKSMAVSTENEPGPDQIETEAPAAPSPTPASRLDEAALSELAREREKLREQLNQERSLASLPEIPKPVEPAPDPESDGDTAHHGTIRELDLSGWPQPVVDEIMQRYRLRVVRKAVTGPLRNSFLSSASDPSGDRYFASSRTPPGVYEVFELSRDAVSKMSQAEEEAIVKRGWTPSETHVSHIRFGIVEGASGKPDLGVLTMEAAPL